MLNSESKVKVRELAGLTAKEMRWRQMSRLMEVKPFEIVLYNNCVSYIFCFAQLGMILFRPWQLVLAGYSRFQNHRRWRTFARERSQLRVYNSAHFSNNYSIINMILINLSYSSRLLP